jgi:hypothetical protein
VQPSNDDLAEASSDPIPFPGGYTVATGVASTKHLAVMDEHGLPVEWPLDGRGAADSGSGQLVWHAQSHATGGYQLDTMVPEALDASTSKAKGASSTGMNAWMTFCREGNTPHVRVLDPRASLFVKLEEEWNVMRSGACSQTPRPATWAKCKAGICASMVSSCAVESDSSDCERCCGGCEDCTRARAGCGEAWLRRSWL